MNIKAFLTAILTLSLTACSGMSSQKNESAEVVSETAIKKRAKYEPPEDKVLVFVGQDNISVGGTDKWQDGYVDHIGVPAGITHYVYFTEGKENNYGFSFDNGTIDGLNTETTWGAGPMCMTCYLESEKLKDTVMHLSISMEFGSEDEIAAGEHDHLIAELVALLQKYDHVPFLIRIGYEFDGSWNDYDAPNFKLAWRRIVDTLRDNNVDNFATVLASSRHHIEAEKWDEYWPGDGYVDWIGYSYWSNTVPDSTAFEVARKKGLPVFIAETAPRGFWLNQTSGGMIWFDWYSVLFDHIEKNKDVIKAVSYINANWDEQPMWTGWGDSRIQINEELKKRWLEQMDKNMYVHGTEGTYELIGFEPK